MTQDISARVVAHYLGGEDALPAASRAALEAAGIRVQAAESRAALRKLAVALPADALLVSAAALTGSPARTVPALRRLYGRKDLAVLVLGPSPDGWAARVLAAGADDALDSGADPALLVARVEAALRTVSQLAAPAAWPRGVLRTPDAEIALDLRAQRCLVRTGGGYREVLLTRKQLAALAALLRAGGRPVSWANLFARGWRPGRLRRRSRTLVQHVLALRRKLGAAGRRIAAVPGLGYRLSD
ncbi:MAG: winged helix-turn-helix domain-containing protein [Elusimicrobiota bacterium]